MDGLSDSHNELNTHYLEMCGAPKRVQFFLFCKTFTTHVLTFIWQGGVELKNHVTVVFICKDAVSTTPEYCKLTQVNVIL